MHTVLWNFISFVDLGTKIMQMIIIILWVFELVLAQDWM